MIMFVCVLSECDKDKIEKIFNDHNLMLYRVTYKLLQSDIDAQDAVSQAYLNIMEHMAKINSLPSSEVIPYCVVIAKNVAYDILRKKNRLVYMEEIETNKNDSWDMDEKLLRESDQEQLLRAMAHLKDADRYLLELRFAKEMAYRDIGILMGVNEDTARKRGQRALKKLRELYEKEESK